MQDTQEPEAENFGNVDPQATSSSGCATARSAVPMVNHMEESGTDYDLRDTSDVVHDGKGGFMLVSQSHTDTTSLQGHESTTCVGVDASSLQGHGSLTSGGVISRATTSLQGHGSLTSVGGLACDNPAQSARAKKKASKDKKKKALISENHEDFSCCAATGAKT